MDRIRNIVVGVDFSEQSRRALEEALRIAQWSRAGVHIVHVIDAPTAEDIAEAAGVVGINDVADFAHRHVVDFAETAAELKLIAEESDARSVPADVQVRVGHAYRELLNRARETQAELLVLGAAGAGEAAAGLGTLATHCVREAPLAVLLVRGAQRGPFRRIVAAVDHSLVSRAVVAHALRLACQDQARLEVLHVYQPPWEMTRYWPRADAPREAMQRCVARRNAQMSELIAPFEPEMRFVHGETRTIAAADCKRGIVEFVRAAQADLVVLGTRGRTRDEDVSIGTTAESIVRDAPCSVLAVRLSDAERYAAARTSQAATQRRSRAKGQRP